MKTIIVIFLSFLSFNLYSQIERRGDMVCMPVVLYNTIAINKYKCDTLKIEYKNLISEQDNSLKLKDSIIEGLKNKCALKDSIISQKDQTIKSITDVRSQSESKMHKIMYKIYFLAGSLAGVIGAIIIIK